MGTRAEASRLPSVKLWLWVSALATLSGWTLSAIGQLNRAGYVAVATLAGVLVWLAYGRPGFKAPAGFSWPKLRRRFRRPWPLVFVIFAVLVFMGGVLYAPTNHTGLSYRTPRVLHWLSEGQWFWIHTPGYRMNDRACGFEWLSAPLLLFTRSDRALFLLNFIPYLLLPGLIFSVFTRLGVPRRVAWPWMWLLPTSYGFLLQAGSIGNDTFPAVYALAAVDFALRARSSRRASDLNYSLIAAALMTGAKASNLPLLLPWFIACVPLLPLLRKKWLSAGAVVVIAAAVSFIPTAVLNIIHCGDWSGLSLERAGMGMQSPVVGIWGNALLLLLHNLAPPFLPQAGWWNANILTVLPEAIVRPLSANFELGFHTLWELPTEDWAGLGMGLSLLLAASLAGGLPLRWRRAGLKDRSRLPNPVQSGVLWGAWFALLAYCVKSGMVTGARLILPYYCLLIPALLLGAGQAQVVRRCWWKTIAWAGVALALVMLVVTPPRPLWPAMTVLGKVRDWKPDSRIVERAFKVYDVYRHRADPSATLRQALPAGLETVGFLADGDDLDISLWRPFLTRQVKHILVGDSGEQVRQRGIRYAVVGGAFLAAKGIKLEEWLARVRAEQVWTGTFTLKVAEGPQPWYIVRFAGE
jgi:hypothetical protein